MAHARIQEAKRKAIDAGEVFDATKRMTSTVLVNSGRHKLDGSVRDDVRANVVIQQTKEANKLNKRQNDYRILLSKVALAEIMEETTWKKAQYNAMVSYLKVKGDPAKAAKIADLKAQYHQRKHRPHLTFEQYFAEQLKNNNHQPTLSNNEEDDEKEEEDVMVADRLLGGTGAL